MPGRFAIIFLKIKNGQKYFESCLQEGIWIIRQCGHGQSHDGIYKNHHLIVNVQQDRIVSSCVCVIIPNLTRNVRPYAFIENVVTLSGFRGRGYATECLDYARNIAEQNNCYKMMLLTGAKDQKILDFYKRAGYNSEDKTAFIQWIKP